jgi:hypothetical protein
MSQFKFRSLVGSDIGPEEWLRIWASRYPETDYLGYSALLAKHKSLCAEDFIQIGKWKDAVNTDGRWKANVASVAYVVWMLASKEQPQCPIDSQVAAFLNDWGGREYTDEFASGPKKKTFGLSRATTLLHFLSGGHFPIFDSRVRKAMKRLVCPVPNSVPSYLHAYCPLFSEIAALCNTEDLRMVDKALFSYGARILPFPN